MSQLYASLFYEQQMTTIFSDEQLLTYMLQAEVALAMAQAKLGLIPQSAALHIAQVAEQGSQIFDLSSLASAAGLAGNIAIPFVKQLTAAVKQTDEDAARYVHWGATSQDILDTACILQCRDALDLLDTQLTIAYQTALHQTELYRDHVMIGRTWLQQGLPITLGHKIARWAASFKRDLSRIQALKRTALCVQLGGAVGSLAALADQGGAVVTAFAEQLKLTAPLISWHTERDRIVEIASTVAIVVGNLGKMARDWSLMMQTEVAEVFEPTAAGRGGSSTMPHKRNPVAAASVLAAANRVPALMASIYAGMVQEHERGLGGWHAEWLSLPEIFQLCAGALLRSTEVIAHLQVDATAMQRNLQGTQGLIMAEAVMMALAPALGRLQAHHVVEQACQQAVQSQCHLIEVLSTHSAVQAHFSREHLEHILDPASYLGNIQQQIDAVLRDAQGEKK